MTGLAFFDTNILVYSDDRDSPQKQRQARRLIRDHNETKSLVISLQVIQEYYSTATRKLGIDPLVAQQKVELLAQGRVIRFTEHDVIAAIELHRMKQLSFWDAMIVHAAKLAGADTLFTEDLQHGATIAGVRVVNPFLDA